MNAVFSNYKRDFGCKGSQYRFCQSPSQSDICRFRHMTLLPLHLVVNWQVFTINIYILTHRLALTSLICFVNTITNHTVSQKKKIPDT